MEITEVYKRLQAFCLAEPDPVLGVFLPHEVFPFVAMKNQQYKTYIGIDGKNYRVHMGHRSYRFFRGPEPYAPPHQHNFRCVICGVEGTHFALRWGVHDKNAYLSPFAVNANQVVRMTWDHILPKCKGGTNRYANLQTMCQKCNTLKADFALNLEEVRELRGMYDALRTTPDPLGKNARNRLVHKRRKELARRNSGEKVLAGAGRNPFE